MPKNTRLGFATANAHLGSRRAKFVLLEVKIAEASDREQDFCLREEQREQIEKSPTGGLTSRLLERTLKARNPDSEIKDFSRPKGNDRFEFFLLFNLRNGKITRITKM